MYAMNLQGRTKDFVVRIIRLTTALPAGRVADVIGRTIEIWNFRRSQLSRGGPNDVLVGTSCRNKNIFLNKATPLMNETAELIAILTTSIKTAKKNIGSVTVHSTWFSVSRF